MNFIDLLAESASKGSHYKSVISINTYKFKESYKNYLQLTNSETPFLPREKKDRAEEIKNLVVNMEKNAKLATQGRLDLVGIYIRQLGNQRIALLKGIVSDFFVCLKKMEQKNKEKFYKFEVNANISADMRQQMEKMDEFARKMQNSGSMTSTEIAGSGLMVASSGALAAVGTPALVTTAVGSLATASTGTAISTLSGAAAQNAILAWLGGGSIATGGGGIAAGATVLTSITTVATGGAAVLVGGLVYYWHSSRELTKAIDSSSEIAKQLKEMEKTWVILDAICERTQELKNVTDELAKRTKKAFEQLKPLSENFDMDNDKHIKIFQQTALLMKALIDIINVAILDDKGCVSAEGLRIIETTKETIKNTELHSL